MTRTHPLILALFDDPSSAARAALALHASGVGRENLSVIARSHDEEVRAARALDATPGVELEDSMPAARLGELGAHVLAAIAMVMPGVGPVIAGGPLAAELGEAAGHAAGSLADHLEAAGLSRVDADVLEAAVQRGSWLLGVHVRTGTAQAARSAVRDAGSTAVYEATWNG